MVAHEWLKQASKQLTNADIPTAHLDAMVLLEDQTGKDRAFLLANKEFTLTKAQLIKLNGCLALRLKHQPLAYVRGKTEFYGREFIINKDVLEPRPESEAMIELFKALKLPAKATILDLGTGSGALGITTKLERPKITVVASDVDQKCLQIAQKNAKKHGVSLKFVYGNLLEPIEDKITVILANLPYVPDDFRLNEAAKNEPKLAIFGGPDGLNIYRQLFEQISSSKLKPGFILTESLPFQHAKLAKIANQTAYKLTKTDDFVQLFVRH